MVEQSRRKGRGKHQPLLGSHQRCWLWGRHVVLETLKARKWPIYELHFARELPEEEYQLASQLAEERGVVYKIAPSDELAKLCKSQEHQGYLAKMPPYPYDDLNSFEKRWPKNPLLLVLDGIQDPYNFGAILRSADVLGVDAVLIGAQNQVRVTSQVARSSAGAVNHLPILRVSDLPDVLKLWKERGIKVYGASEKSTMPLYQMDFTRPTALIIGNEGAGIRAGLLAMCDQRITIPQFGHVESLNAAVSAGILLYEVSRQRNLPKISNHETYE